MIQICMSQGVMLSLNSTMTCPQQLQLAHTCLQSSWKFNDVTCKHFTGNSVLIHGIWIFFNLADFWRSHVACNCDDWTSLAPNKPRPHKLKNQGVHWVSIVISQDAELGSLQRFLVQMLISSLDTKAYIIFWAGSSRDWHVFSVWQMDVWQMPAYTKMSGRQSSSTKLLGQSLKHLKLLQTIEKSSWMVSGIQSCVCYPSLSRLSHFEPQIFIWQSSQFHWVDSLLQKSLSQKSGMFGVLIWMTRMFFLGRASSISFSYCSYYLSS